jgi:hypothetical protein
VIKKELAYHVSGIARCCCLKSRNNETFSSGSNSGFYNSLALYLALAGLEEKYRRLNQLIQLATTIHRPAYKYAVVAPIFINAGVSPFSLAIVRGVSLIRTTNWHGSDPI